MAAFALKAVGGKLTPAFSGTPVAPERKGARTRPGEPK
jgi:hypothetical protein